ncbi:MAG: hypothetical protein PHR35_08835 [Kiritimatiellae bacterium]|nr:hypothetical protein [Kiritimatiellia bacterium]
MAPELTRQEFAAAPRELLHRGRFGNATVWRFPREGGVWVVKDFAACPWIVRWTLGVWLSGREYRALCRLRGLTGVPSGPFRLDALAFGYRYAPGQPLRGLPDGACGRDFFERLEEVVRSVHARGVVHLDLRNARNVLVGADGQPALLDFQSAINTSRWPARWRAGLERIDLSGVYKHWLRHDPGTLGPERETTLRWQLRMRRWWRFRGYSLPGAPQRPLRACERDLLARAGNVNPSAVNEKDGEG